MALPQAQPTDAQATPIASPPTEPVLNGHPLPFAPTRDNNPPPPTAESFREPLLRYAVHLLGDPARAQDVVQDTYTRHCKTPPPSEVSQPGNEGRLKAWLFTVCRNRAFDVLRKERRMTTLPAPVAAAQTHPGPDPADVAQQHDTHAHVLQRLAKLPDAQQEVVRLKFQGELSYKQIAEVTGLTVSHVGYLLHHALKTLRHELVTPD